MPADYLFLETGRSPILIISEGSNNFEGDIVEENKMWADACPLANIATGMLIISLWSLLFGVASPLGIIGALPWILISFPIILIAIVICFKNGEIINGTVNSILTAMALCQNGIKGLIVLAFVTKGIEVPSEVEAVIALVDGGAYIVGTVLLITLFFICFRTGQKTLGFFILFAILGFFSFAVTNLGFADLNLLAAVSLTIFGAWLVYSGCAMLIENVLGKKILPF
jgi:hypothetical protein